LVGLSGDILVILVRPTSYSESPRVIGCDAATGQARWIVSMKTFYDSSRSAFDVLYDWRIRVTSTCVHVYYLAFGLGIRYTILDVRNGQVTFTHKITEDSRVITSTEDSTCQISWYPNTNKKLIRYHPPLSIARESQSQSNREPRSAFELYL